MNRSPLFPFFTRFTCCFIVGEASSLSANLLIGGSSLIVLSVLAASITIGRKDYYWLYPALFLAGYLYAYSFQESRVTGKWEKLYIQLDEQIANARHGTIRAYKLADVWHRGYQPVVLFSNDSIPTFPGDYLVSSGRLLNNARYATPAVWVTEGWFMEPRITWLGGIRQRVTRRFIRLLRPTIRGPAMGIFMGLKRYLSPQTYDLYRKAGGAHILAVSGLHVGILYAVLGFFTRWLGNSRFSRAFKCIILLGPLWTYAALTGFTPSVVRAACFLSLFAVSRWVLRPMRLDHSLMLTLFVAGVFDPRQLFALGFQLSYLAVAGILVFLPIIVKRIRNTPIFQRYIIASVGVSASAQILSIPLIALTFGAISPAGLISSVILIPYAFIVIVGMIVLFIGGNISWIYDGLNRVLEVATAWVNDSLQGLLSVPYTYVPVSPGPWNILLYYLGILLLYMAVRWPRKVTWLIGILYLFALTF